MFCSSVLILTLFLKFCSGSKDVRMCDCILRTNKSTKVLELEDHKKDCDISDREFCIRSVCSQCDINNGSKNLLFESNISEKYKNSLENSTKNLESKKTKWTEKDGTISSKTLNTSDSFQSNDSGIYYLPAKIPIQCVSARYIEDNCTCSVDSELITTLRKLNLTKSSSMISCFCGANPSLELLTIVSETYKKSINLSYSWLPIFQYDEIVLCRSNPFWLNFSAPDFESVGSKLLSAIYSFVALAGCCGNSMVIYLFMSCRSLRTPSNLLIVNLALSDFCLVSTLFLYLYNAFHHGMAIGATGCSMYGFIGGASGTSSIVTLSVISLDRCMAITYPLDMSKKLTTRRAWLFIVLIWLYSCFFAGIPLLGFPQIVYTPEGFMISCSFDYLNRTTGNYLFIWSYFVGSWVIPLCSIGGSYTKIIQIVRDAKFSGRDEEYSRRIQNPDFQRVMQGDVRRCSSVRHVRTAYMMHKRSKMNKNIALNYSECELSTMSSPALSSFSSSKQASQNYTNSEHSFGLEVAPIHSPQCREAKFFGRGSFKYKNKNDSSVDNIRKENSSGYSSDGHWTRSKSCRWKAGSQMMNERDNSYENSLARQNKLMRTQPREVRLVRISAGIIALWFLSWTPYAFLSLLGIIGAPHLITPVGSMVPALICKLAACVDPYVYALSHPRCKIEIKKKVRNFRRFCSFSRRKFCQRKTVRKK